jgi:hypothetical protein
VIAEADSEKDFCSTTFLDLQNPRSLVLTFIMAVHVGVFIKLLIIFCSIWSTFATEIDEAKVAECGLYLMPSRNPEHGRGLVAGKFIVEEQQIDISVTVAIRTEDITGTQLNNYVFGTEEDGIAVAELGLDMLYNHNEISFIKRMWAPTVLSKFEDQKLAHTTYSEVIIKTVKNVSGR